MRPRTKKTEYLAWEFEVPTARTGLRSRTETMIALGTLVKDPVISTAC
jgi:hypothetical protein